MKFIKEIIAKPLFKATSLNGISLLLKISIGFITSKFIAVFVGPSGMALVGNLRNFLTSTEAVATLGFENGVVKYVAEHKNEKEKLRQTLSTIFITILCLTFVLGIVFFFSSNFLNDSIFGTPLELTAVFKVLAIALPFYIGNLFITATINGLGVYKKVIYTNIIGSIIGLVVSIVLIWQMKTLGALFSIIITPSLLFFLSLYFVNTEISFFENINKRYFKFSFLRNLSSYSLMTFVSAFLGAFVLLAIRKKIIVSLGIEQAGYWEAMGRISSYYLLFVSSILGLYFLPKLSVAKNNNDTKQLFREYYKTIVPLFILGMFVLYFFRDFIIQILFTKAFSPVATLFFWQLIGDSLKVASLILGYEFFAKKLTKAFIFFELLSLSILYISSLFFVSKYGIKGIVMAHSLTYFIYFVCLALFFRKKLF